MHGIFVLNHVYCFPTIRCMESQETKDVYDHYDKMLELIGEFEQKVYEEWTAGVDEACSFNLNQPLITRNADTKLIAVNFDNQVKRDSNSIKANAKANLSFV